ncbi:MAG: hypothetical protein JRH20_10400 [Deltaproteobacteria bacterium]|nr:hypothetical protein [Deltaproteobacteria bacterium]
MIAIRTLHFPSSVALVRGLRGLRDQGIHCRGLLFLALNERGEAHLAIAEDLSDGAKVKIGQKLALKPPFSGRVFYFDAVHPVGRQTAIVNGDRRIGKLATLVDATALVASYAQEMDGQSVFFGCTPHQPGSWWVQGTTAIPLHERGFVECIPMEAGVVARRTLDDSLYFLPADGTVAGDAHYWQAVYKSPLGNILMLERRTHTGRLVLSCQRGLVEVDLRGLPRVREDASVELPGGYAVLGRITDGAFAVSRGIAQDWGFDELGPATLLGSRGGNLKKLAKLLSKHPQLL